MCVLSLSLSIPHLPVTAAYYNPDEEDAAGEKNKKIPLGIDAGAGFGGDRKNSEIIVNQPLARHCSTLR